ncbi:glycosyltransferase [Candidatus Dojkabacteria bacterium]|uniref:Glycosyltransferase n=1 Tax=Candidatus Dojkabacteria bacterium TaxID=2099670 RepID=A0A955L0F8_9BACT|nr:glycosyltransferase [Candidatus Dojkabacteria bacterium]
MHKVISIVTSTYNQGRYISEAMDSVIKQAGDFYIDYLVVDGASTDNTIDLVESTKQKIQSLPEKFSVSGINYYAGNGINCLGVSLRYLSQKDRGTADGVNKGINLAKGDVFGYLHSDDRYEQGAFAAVFKAFAEDKELAVVYGKGSYIDEESECIGEYPAQDIAKEDIYVNCLISQPSGFISMKIVREVGGLNINIQNSFDYEYWLRIYHAGYKFLYIPKVFSSTRIHPATKTSNNKRRIHLENMAVVKHYNDMVPFAAKVDAALHFSPLGIFSQKLLWHMPWLQKQLARLYAEVFFQASLPLVDTIEKEIFS